VARVIVQIRAARRAQSAAVRTAQNVGAVGREEERDGGGADVDGFRGRRDGHRERLAKRERPFERPDASAARLRESRCHLDVKIEGSELRERFSIEANLADDP
jgi:hypothetical protein